MGGEHGRGEEPVRPAPPPSPQPLTLTSHTPHPTRIQTPLPPPGPQGITDAALLATLSKKLAPPLVTLLGAEPEIQYVALRNINLIVQKHPGILSHEVKVGGALLTYAMNRALVGTAPQYPLAQGQCGRPGSGPTLQMKLALNRRYTNEVV